MAEVTISINGRSYDIACDNGQEGRLVEIASYIDQKLEQISRGGGAYNDSHLLVLTALVIADELFDAQTAGASTTRTVQRPAAPPVPVNSKEDEQAVARVLEQLTRRIEGIASRLQAA